MTKRAAETMLHHAMCRFTFKLSPGQEPLQLASPFALSPKTGVFVTPQLREP